MVSLSVHVDCWYTVLFFGSLFESTWRILEMSVLCMTTDPPYLLVPRPSECPYDHCRRGLSSVFDHTFTLSYLSCTSQSPSGV